VGQQPPSTLLAPSRFPDSIPPLAFARLRGRVPLARSRGSACSRSRPRRDAGAPAGVRAASRSRVRRRYRGPRTRLEPQCCRRVRSRPADGGWRGGEYGHPRYDSLNGDRGDIGPLSIVGRNGRQPYEITVRGVSDDHGRAVGRLIVFHDVGEYLGQQQRLNVLNRVFRHDVRTETNLIHGYADQLMTNPSDERALSIVKKSASRILDLSERTPGPPASCSTRSRSRSRRSRCPRWSTRRSRTSAQNLPTHGCRSTAIYRM